MALETLGFVSEKTSIILDIGNVYTKCGLGGELSPRCIISSQFNLPMKEGKSVLLHDITDSNLLYDCLKNFLQRLFMKHLITNARDRRIIVVESPLSTTVFRNTLAKLLFDFFQVLSVCFVPCHLMVLYTLGIRTALVVDMGYAETSVLPIYENMPLLNAWQSLPRAARAVHNRLESRLLEVGTVVVDGATHPLASVCNSLNDAVLEDITVRCCFVTKLSRGNIIQAVQTGQLNKSELPQSPPSIDYPLDGERVLKIGGEIREEVCEVLFDKDGDENSVANLLLDAILESPIDARRPLAENIVIVGGTAMMQGIKHRLKCELDDLLSKPKYNSRIHLTTFKFHSVPAKENYAAWLGASMFGNLSVVTARSLSREMYTKSGLPDWCVIRDRDTSDLPVNSSPSRTVSLPVSSFTSSSPASSSLLASSLSKMSVKESKS